MMQSKLSPQYTLQPQLFKGREDLGFSIHGHVRYCHLRLPPMCNEQISGKASKITRTGDFCPINILRGSRYWYANFASLNVFKQLLGWANVRDIFFKQVYVMKLKESRLEAQPVSFNREGGSLGPPVTRHMPSEQWSISIGTRGVSLFIP